MNLEKSLEHAAEHLLEGWSIHISVENGAGWVRAEKPDGTMVEMHEDETDFAEQVRAAVRLAHDEKAADALSQENAPAMESAHQKTTPKETDFMIPENYTEGNDFTCSPSSGGQEHEQEKCGTTHYAGCACHEKGWENKWKCAVEMAARATAERDELLAAIRAYRDEAIIKYTGQANEYEKQRNTALAQLEKARKQLAEIEQKVSLQLGGHPNSKLWGEAGLIAATMRCVDALDEVTEQRDRLIEALLALRENESFSIGGAAYEIVEQAIQSMHPNANPTQRATVAHQLLVRRIAQRDRKISGLERKTKRLEEVLAWRTIDLESLSRNVRQEVQDALCNVRMIPVLGVNRNAVITEVRNISASAIVHPPTTIQPK